MDFSGRIDDSREKIYFYGHSEGKPFKEFSNFSPHPIELNGVRFLTVEHYFQAAKFFDAEYVDLIIKSSTPGRAKKLGQSRAVPLRNDWEEVKDQIMLEGVRAKFEQHPGLAHLLISTKDKQIVENAPRDFYWGIGSGRGKNALGKILEIVRGELKNKGRKDN